MKVYSFKAAETDHARWSKDAERLGITFGEWVRRKLNDGAISTAEPKRKPKEKPPPPKPLLAQVALKKGTCDHRLPPGTYCKRCQKLKR